MGPSAAWETRYLPAVRKLTDRIRITAVFDSIAARAQQVARECGADVVYGICSLVNRRDVDAVLFLDAGWHGMEALRILCAGNKPIYIAAEIGNDITALRACHWTAVSYGLTLMPELGWRYTPATGRLQELMATRLGRARKLCVDAALHLPKTCETSESETEKRYLASLLDWSRYLIRTAPARIDCKHLNPNGNGEPVHQIRVTFEPPRSEKHAPIAEFRFHHQENQTSAQSEAYMRYQIECESGTAVIDSSNAISWKTDSQPIEESLTTDRDEVEVMLDHFCRRVVGGLVPVADLADIYRGIHLLQAVEESDRTGKTVSVERDPLIP
ncbi:MAG: hypothetical protein Tsb009_37530 [Planctomycetaceae bacterium]